MLIKMKGKQVHNVWTIAFYICDEHVNVIRKPTHFSTRPCIENARNVLEWIFTYSDRPHLYF